MGRKAHQASISAVKANQRTLSRTVSKGWTIASKAPMFCKTTTIPQPPNANGEPQSPIVKRRSARLINGDAYRIAASGAAQAATLFHAYELERFGLIPEAESVTTPWAPSVSPGSKAMLEQFLVAYTQGALAIARTIMTTCNRHTRLNKTLIDMGFAIMREQVFTDRSPSGRNVVVLPLKKRVAGSSTNRSAETDVAGSTSANTAYTPEEDEGGAAEGDPEDEDEPAADE